MHAYPVDIFDSPSAAKELVNIGVSTTGRLIMADKLKFIVIKLKNINSTALNILKQEALSIGAELANHKDVITGQIAKSDSLLFGTPVQLRFIVKKIKHQDFGLKVLARELDNILLSIDRNRKKSDPAIIKTAGQDLIFDGKTYIMGILNVTPDSFSDGGKYFDINKAVKRGIEIESEGADILDLGGESTRPGAKAVSVSEEIERICPVIYELSRNIEIPISVDTRKPEVAAEALKAGASIINDVSGLSYDEQGMGSVLLKAKAPYIMMHSNGKNPEDMQKDLMPYEDVFYDIISYFSKKVEYLENIGYGKNNIIIDPGFGFAKSADDNYKLLGGIASLRSLGLPIAAGVSRKSFINGVTGKNKNNLLSGNIGAAVLLKLKGTDIVRVHEVKETAAAFSIIDKINQTNITS